MFEDLSFSLPILLFYGRFTKTEKKAKLNDSIKQTKAGQYWLLISTFFHFFMYWVTLPPTIAAEIQKLKIESVII